MQTKDVRDESRQAAALHTDLDEDLGSHGGQKLVVDPQVQRTRVAGFPARKSIATSAAHALLVPEDMEPVDQLSLVRAF